MPDWLIALAVAAVLVPGAGYLVWEPAKLSREWRVDSRKRTKYDFMRITLWWSFQAQAGKLGELGRVHGLYELVDMGDVPRDVLRSWGSDEAEAVVERLLATLWELSAEAPSGRLERDADNARRELQRYYSVLKDPDFYAEGVIDAQGRKMFKAFRSLYRRDPILSVSGRSTYGRHRPR